jgi:hypothetical protein
METRPMTLIVTNNGNTKIRKSAEGTPYRIASLSLWPDDSICPGSPLAQCREDCLKLAGRGQQLNVQKARVTKTELWHRDQDLFLTILEDELRAFIKSCNRSGDLPAARLNTISDIPWEKHGIPQLFPELKLYDYTKLAARLNRTPENYKLMFSYSGAPAYQNQVRAALKTTAPISVVFRGGFPKTFLGREVINGDASDLVNLSAENKIVALRLKGGPAIQASRSPFIVDNPELMLEAA